MANVGKCAVIVFSKISIGGNWMVSIAFLKWQFTPI